MDIDSESPAPPPTQSSAKSDDDGVTPDFLMLEQIPVNYVQQIETDLLETVVFNQGTSTTDGFCRFTLQNKGFLHSHSKLFIALKVDATNTDCFPMPHIGVGQVVKKAVLKIGNKTINEIDSWRSLYAMKSAQISNEIQVEREQYLTGRYVNHDFEYADGSKFNAPTYGLANNMEMNGDDIEVPDWMKNSATAPLEAPSFAIDLADLFPFLKVHQLPLYMISEPINIELTFFPTIKERLQIAGGETVDIPIEIVRDELKFCADYIFYGATDEMERYRARNPEINFSFVDYRVIEHSTTSGALASGVVRNLGMANRLVPRILTELSDTTAGEQTLLGSVVAKAPVLNASGETNKVVKLQYNVKYNDRFEYTTALDSMSRLFSQYTHSEGVPFLTRQEYSGESVTGGLTDNTFEGRGQDVSLEGNFGYLATRLTNGRVGQRGIDLHLQGNYPASVNLMRSFCEYVRVATLSGGMFEIYNA